MSTSTDIGYCEGDICNRNGCKGVVALHAAEDCSCHLHPPCPACTAPRAYCETCDWQQSEDRVLNDHVGQWKNGVFKDYGMRRLDPTKLDWHSLSHTHFSMIKRGVYPEGMSMAAVREQVNGTFGGRFNYFRDGKFEFVAYTD